MSALKQSLRLAPIDAKQGARFLEDRHPLGGGLSAPIAIGVFWLGRLEGVITFGRPVVNNAVQRYALRASDVLELRKMWVSDVPPRNTESRALAVAVRLVARQYPVTQMLLTYCDSEEQAAAYKAVGWIPQEAYRYLRNVKVGGRWVSLREVNRRGGLKRLGAEYETEIGRASCRERV